MAEISIVTCYKKGTKDILSVMLESIARHTSNDMDYELVHDLHMAVHLLYSSQKLHQAYQSFVFLIAVL